MTKHKSGELRCPETAFKLLPMQIVGFPMRRLRFIGLSLKNEWVLLFLSEDEDVKSEISIVHELALRLNMPVSFEVSFGVHVLFCILNVPSC